MEKGYGEGGVMNREDLALSSTHYQSVAALGTNNHMSAVTIYTGSCLDTLITA